jgi:hypothetical protein
MEVNDQFYALTTLHAGKMTQVTIALAPTGK